MTHPIEIQPTTEGTAEPVGRCLVDTNILSRSLQPASPHYSPAKEALQKLIEEGYSLYVTPQILIELTGFLTRPKVVLNTQGQEVSGGLGLSISEALTEIANIQTFCDLLPETPAIWQEWQSLVLRCPPQGKAVHDTRIAASMKAYNLTHILTFNVKDFKRFVSEGITIIDPLNP